MENQMKKKRVLAKIQGLRLGSKTNYEFNGKDNGK